LVRLIMGLKGSGKTKQLVELVREAVAQGNGDVVCIEKDKKLTYDIPYQARLIDIAEYSYGSYEFIKGFICGLHSGNYDITHVFIDNFLKIVNSTETSDFSAFLAWLEKLSEKESVDFIISVTADPETADESIKKYLY